MANGRMIVAIVSDEAKPADATCANYSKQTQLFSPRLLQFNQYHIASAALFGF